MHIKHPLLLAGVALVPQANCGLSSGAGQIDLLQALGLGRQGTSLLPRQQSFVVTRGLARIVTTITLGPINDTTNSDSPPSVTSEDVDLSSHPGLPATSCGPFTSDYADSIIALTTTEVTSADPKPMPTEDETTDDPNYTWSETTIAATLETTTEVTSSLRPMPTEDETTTAAGPITTLAVTTSTPKPFPTEDETTEDPNYTWSETTIGTSTGIPVITPVVTTSSTKPLPTEDETTEDPNYTGSETTIGTNTPVINTGDDTTFSAAATPTTTVTDFTITIDETIFTTVRGRGMLLLIPCRDEARLTERRMGVTVSWGDDSFGWG